VENRAFGLRQLQIALIGLGLLVLGCGDALAQGAAGSSSSSSKSIGASIKDGWDGFTGLFTTKKAPPSEAVDDAVSLKSTAKASSNVYVAVARMYEQAGKLAEAEKQYQLALNENKNDVAAMLGYARLKEEMDKPEEAIALYQKASKIAPEEPTVFNNLGLCYARRNMKDEAVAALGRAILLQPKNALYRNNIAAVLVENGKMQEAYSHLRAVNSDAVSYYNLGYLLYKKGKTQEALRHFTIAAQLDPSMEQAKQWVVKLGDGAAPSAPAASQTAVKSQQTAIEKQGNYGKTVSQNKITVQPEIVTPRTYKPSTTVRTEPSESSRVTIQRPQNMSELPPLPSEPIAPNRSPTSLGPIVMPLDEPPEAPLPDVLRVPETARLPDRSYRSSPSAGQPAQIQPAPIPPASSRNIELLPPIN
jgi:tetratricopeptide (TPR) repeat protein